MRVIFVRKQNSMKVRAKEKGNHLLKVMKGSLRGPPMMTGWLVWGTDGVKNQIDLLGHQMGSLVSVTTFAMSEINTWEDNL